MAPIQYGTRVFLLEPDGVRLAQEEHHYQPKSPETESDILARMQTALGTLPPGQRASVQFTYHAGRIQYAKLIVITPPVPEESPA